MSFSAAEQVCLQVSCKSCRRQWRKTQVFRTNLQLLHAQLQS